MSEFSFAVIKIIANNAFINSYFVVPIIWLIIKGNNYRVNILPIPPDGSFYEEEDVLLINDFAKRNIAPPKSWVKVSCEIYALPGKKILR